ncbi:hypothetical protein KIV65_gp08 [Mycobacterium phage Anthony]|uniref:Gene product 88 domain-containing protein n=1 Tax=Mycobacterium phage Anthony TaxID=2599857 RepID=A0A5J6TKX5_9CAUD|nr:hypothetical protein KIV65_gp08 [Mycobacterium phage Anthony]QFG10459.1 hypothetical protein PBI_ANTHONY_89 [Mycobacterium phage Anthony]
MAMAKPTTVLTRSKDRKVTNLPNKAGTQGLIANAFGLPSGRQFSCPEATDFCGQICYAGKLEKIYKGVSAVLLRNWEALKDAGLEDTTILLEEMIAAFVKDCDKRGARKIFRIHWDGDFFSGTYVAAWSRVIKANPEVQFWAYTRVATAATFLHAQKHDNLSLYFSSDEDNVTVARALADKGIRIAHVAKTFDQGKAEFSDAVRCPENNKAIALISDKGSACARCGLCVDGRRNVLFSTTKK